MRKQTFLKEKRKKNAYRIKLFKGKHCVFKQFVISGQSPTKQTASCHQQFIRQWSKAINLMRMSYELRSTFEHCGLTFMCIRETMLSTNCYSWSFDIYQEFSCVKLFCLSLSLFLAIHSYFESLTLNLCNFSKEQKSNIKSDIFWSGWKLSTTNIYDEL